MRFSDFNDETKYRIYQASRDNLIKSMNDNRSGTLSATDYKIECARLVGSIEEKMDELNRTHSFTYENAEDSRPSSNEIPVTIDYTIIGNEYLEYENKTRKEIDKMKTDKIEELKNRTAGPTTGTAPSAQLTQIQTELDELQARHTALVNDKTRIQNELDQCENNLVIEKRDLKTVEERRDAFELSLKKKEEELASTLKELQQVKTRLQFSDTNLNQETAKVRQLEQEESRLKQEVEQLTQRMRASTSATQTSTLVANNSTQQADKILQLETQINKLRSELDRINDEKANLSAEVETLKQKIQELGAQIEEKTSGLINAAQEHETSARNRIKELNEKHDGELRRIMGHILEITSEFTVGNAKTDITDLLKDYSFLRDSIEEIQKAEQGTIKKHEASLRGNLETEHSKVIQEKEAAHALTTSALEALKIRNDEIALEFRELNQKYEELLERIEIDSPDNLILADSHLTQWDRSGSNDYASAPTSPSIQPFPPIETQQKKVEEQRADMSENMWSTLELNPQIVTETQPTSPPPVENVVIDFENLPGQNPQTESISPSPIMQEESNFIKAFRIKLAAKKIDPATTPKQKMIAYASILIETFESVMWDSNDTIGNIYSALNLNEKEKASLRTNFYNQLKGDLVTVTTRFTAIKKEQNTWNFELPKTEKKFTTPNMLALLETNFNNNVFIDAPAAKKSARLSSVTRE